MAKEIQVCSRCVMDSTVPDIIFDDNGECNYCEQFDAIAADSPMDEYGEEYLEQLIHRIKKQSKGQKYDVVVGVSGGVDSTFLVHYAIKHGLRVLAVNFDNGWHSEIAVANIRSILEKLNVDLVTYVVDYDEMKDILLSFMKAGMPWIDAPTDMALVATLYNIAVKHSVKTIFVGNSFRTEGKQPISWTYCDAKLIKTIHKKYGTQKLKSFPLLTPWRLAYLGCAKGVKMVRPFNHMHYDKMAAKTMLTEDYSWKDYGGHHHESAFTKFAISTWLPQKFAIDKRKVSYSAQVRSGLLQRDAALQLLAQPCCGVHAMEEEKVYVIKKLGITPDEFEQIWNGPNRSIYDYSSYLPFIKKYFKHVMIGFKYILPFKPMLGYELKTK